MVERLFLAVPRGCLQFVIVVFPDHTHLLFLLPQGNLGRLCFSLSITSNKLFATRDKCVIFFLKEDLTVSSVSTIRAAGAPTKLGRITFF